MRIQSLELRAFGPFTGTVLDLSSGQEGVHIIYGPNEAGKSSSLRALHDLLYGIPARSNDNFQHEYSKLRIAALLKNRVGEELGVVRRKGTKNTLRDVDDRGPLEDDCLQAYLGEASEDIFQTMFGLDHEGLRSGGEEIAKGEGRIGELLFLAGGVHHLRSIQKALEDREKSLFRSGGRTQAISSGLTQLRETREEVRRLQLSLDEWTERQEQLEQAKARKAELDSLLQEKQRVYSRLTRIEQALPSVGYWRTAKNELAELNGAPLLRDEFAQARIQAQTDLEAANRDRQAAEDELNRLDAAIAEVELPEAVLAQQEAIESLQQRLQSYRNSVKDFPKLEASLRSAESERLRILRELGREPQLFEDESTGITADKRARIQELGSEYEVLIERQRSAQRNRQRVEAQLDEDQKTLVELGELADVSTLSRVIDSVQQQGNLDQQLLQAKRQLAESQQQAGIALSKLTLFAGTLEQAISLPLPSQATIERFEAELRECDSKRRTIEERLADADRELRETELTLEKLESGQTIPSEEDLSGARQLRDRGWELLQRRLPAAIGGEAKTGTKKTEPTADEKAFLTNFSEGMTLTSAYRLSVQRADELADRLRREAERVARKSALLAEKQSRVDQLDRLREHAQKAVDVEEECEAQWREVWKPCGIVPLSPKEMQSWVRQHEKIVEQAAKIRESTRLVESLEEQISSAITAVRTQTAKLGESGQEVCSLAETLQSARDLAERLRQRNVQIERLSERIETAKGDLKDALQDHREAEDALNAWKQSWSREMQGLGLESDARTAEANAVLERLARLDEILRESEQFRQRVELVREEIQSFQADAAALAHEVHFSEGSENPESTALRLNALCAEARRTQQKLEDHQQQRARQQEALETATTRIADAEAVLEKLRVEAGCESIEELPILEQQSRTRRQLEQVLVQHQEALLQVSKGASLEAFVNEVEDLDPDTLPGQIRELESETQRLQSERESLLARIRELEIELNRMSGQSEAIEKAQQCESLAARLTRELQEFAAYRCAGAILHAAIEQYRKRNEGPVLVRGSQYFSQLTNGVYLGIQPDFDEQGKPVLYAVRGPGQELVRVDALSDGTRDQLFLALRLASVEHWIEEHEPLPLILDDILLTFDDDRARSALTVLAELSARTQVLFFTHHAHLVELAREVVPAAQLSVQQLGSRSA